MFQSLGLRSHTWWPVISQGAKIWAVILFIGYAVVPGAVLAGLGKSYIEKVKSSAPAVTEPTQEAK